MSAEHYRHEHELDTETLAETASASAPTLPPAPGGTTNPE
jgi:hypothetical protein